MLFRPPCLLKVLGFRVECLWEVRVWVMRCVWAVSCDDMCLKFKGAYEVCVWVMRCIWVMRRVWAVSCGAYELCLFFFEKKTKKLNKSKKAAYTLSSSKTPYVVKRDSAPLLHLSPTSCSHNKKGISVERWLIVFHLVYICTCSRYIYMQYLLLHLLREGATHYWT